jgi:hypothetical protein
MLTFADALPNGVAWALPATTPARHTAAPNIMSLRMFSSRTLFSLEEKRLRGGDGSGAGGVINASRTAD